MKKNNCKNKGFTLIELLVVIVIMGVLLFVGVPAMSKVVENSRKDTFVTTAVNYADAVSTMWSSDGLLCKSGGEDVVSSALPEGDYYVEIDTTGGKSGLVELVEKGGNSSWGNKPVKGYVRINVSKEGRPKFYILLSDGTHGILDGTVATDLRRSSLKIGDNGLAFPSGGKSFLPQNVDGCREN